MSEGAETRRSCVWGLENNLILWKQFSHYSWIKYVFHAYYVSDTVIGT